MSNENLGKHLDSRHSGVNGPNRPGPTVGPLVDSGLVHALRAWHVRLHRFHECNHVHTGGPL